MPKMLLRQPGSIYSPSGPFTKSKEIIQKFTETGHSWYIYQNELHKACFQRDVGYGDFKDLTSRTAADKILHGKAFNIAKNMKCDGYERIALQWFINFSIKKLLVMVLKMRICQTSN